MKEGTEQMVERHISEAVNDRTLGELALFASSVEEKRSHVYCVPSAGCAFAKFQTAPLQRRHTIVDRRVKDFLTDAEIE